MKQKRVGRIFRLVGAIAILSVALALIAGLALRQNNVAYAQQSSTAACDDNIIVDALDGGGYYADISSAVQNAHPGSIIEAQGTYTYTNVRTGKRVGSNSWFAPSPMTLPLPPAGQQVMYQYDFTGTISVNGNPTQCAYGFIDIGS